MREARAHEKDVLSQVSKGEYLPPSNETVKEIAAKWIERKVQVGTYKRASLEQWKNHVNRFIVVELGDRKVSQIDVEAIEDAAAAWSKKVSPVTVNKLLMTLTSVFDLAMRYRLVKENPARVAERLKLATEDEESVQVAADQVYTKSEVRRLIEATDPGSVDRVFLMTLALLGLRIGEARALTWQTIDLKSGRLEVVLNLADSGKGEAPLFTSPKTKEQPAHIVTAAGACEGANALEIKMPY